MVEKSNIGVITDKDFGLKCKNNRNPRVRMAVRGIIIRKDGKIALFNKTKKNEYKLPGGGVEKDETLKKAFQREILEETGCKVKNIKKLGVITEKRTLDKFEQTSYVYIALVSSSSNKLNLTQKEKDEGGRVIWVKPEGALNLISDCFYDLKESKYENMYHSKFIVARDKKILEYYLASSQNKWNSLYKKHIKEDFNDWDEYFKIKMKLKKRFIDYVIKYSKDKKPILECGCGTGKTSVYLASLGINTYALDNEVAMVKEAKKLSNKIVPNNKVKVIEADAFSIPFEDKFFSVTHSSGVLEHYSDDEIVALINEQLRVSDYCVFSVPTSYFEKKMLGNERFMSRKEWRRIISHSRADIVKESGYHYKILKNRIIDVLKKPKRLFKPIALYVFVLKERGD